MSNKQGMIEYRCRRCSKVFSSLHAPDILQAVMCAIYEWEQPKGWGHIVKTLEIHNCDGKNIGVADIIGATVDES